MTDAVRESAGGLTADSDWDRLVEMVACSDKTVMLGSECVILVDDVMQLLRPHLCQHQKEEGK